MSVYRTIGPLVLITINPKFLTIRFYHRELQPKDENRIAKSDDPDQTATLEALWSGSALFALICLSKT